MKKVIAVMIMALALLAGCGSLRDEKVYIEYVTIDRKTMDEICPYEDKTCYGIAAWYKNDFAFTGKVTLCTIYLLPADDYHNIAAYEMILKHEKRHCYEGNWHE